MTEQKRFLILGSNSFSGSAFCKYLLDRNQLVIGISRSPEPDPAFLRYKWREDLFGFEFFQLDINSQMQEIRNIFKHTKIDFVVNFAAQSMVAQSWDKPQDWINTNVMSLTNLLQVLEHVEGLEKYVHISTPEVYGSASGWVSEHFNFSPSTPYAISRAAGDHLVMAYHKFKGVPAVITRAANVYGAGQQLYRLIPRAIYSALENQKFKLDGGGASERVFIHIDDVCDATYKIALAGEVGSSYHISGVSKISILDCVKKIAEQLGKSVEDIALVGPERLGKDKAYLLDSEKIRKELGWSDVVSIDTGIKEAIEWAQKHKSRLSSFPIDYVHKK